MTAGCTMRKKVLVFLDYDLLIRHFVLGGAFADLERQHDVKYVIHVDSTSPKQGIHFNVDQLGLKNVVRFEVPRKRMGSWDQLYSVTALHNQRGTTNYRDRRALMALARSRKRMMYYELLSLWPIFPLARRRIMRRMGVFQPLYEFVAAEKPDIILHPSILAGYFINELLIIAPKLGIPFVTLMNSWDNPSNKAMNTGLPDRLVVWGPQTKAHAVTYMKMPPDRVLEFGAAQFDIYRRPIAESDSELRSIFGVPGNLPVLLYGGASKGADETRHLQMIDEEIEAGRIPRCHVLYRPHPWRGGLSEGEKSFFDVEFKHITMDPHMVGYYQRTAATPFAGFEMADYSVTRKLLHLVSAVVSPLSTILLETIMLGKPVLMFYPELNERSLAAKQVNIGLNLPHFKDFWGVPGVETCTNAADLAASCRRLLADHQSQAVRDGLVAHAKRFLVLDGPSYSERLAELVNQMTSSAVSREAA